MLNLLWLLLPVAFVFGWWAGRRSAGDSGNRVQLDPQHESSYLRGLNYLIHEEQDKAIELFVGISEPDQEMIETQTALGNLFRRRGEFDRAIKIHQSLVERSRGSARSRSDVLVELARDYTASGLLDRAETIYKDLLTRNEHVATAYQELMSIYEQEREWHNAIRIAEESRRITGDGKETRLGHYFCELAEQAVAESDTETARRYLKKSLAEDPHGPRANILRGKLAMRRGDYRRAVECYMAVEQQHPELLPEIIEPLLESYYACGDRPALQTYLDTVKERYNSYSVIKTTRAMIERVEGKSVADKFFKQQVLKRPSLKGLRDWARGELENCKPQEREKVAVIVDMLDSVVDDKPNYCCSVCGFNAKTLHWRCPSCNTWDSARAVIGVEGE